MSLLGLPSEPTLNRVVDRSGRVAAIPPEGLLLSKTLADVLGASLGSRVVLEVLEGSRPVREVPVSGLVDEFLGLSAYMDAGVLHRLMREGDVLSGGYLQVDAAALPALLRAAQAHSGRFRRLL